MSFVEARDYALWVEHIHGNQALQKRILEMQAGDLIDLKVDGLRGTWQKLGDRTDGIPTPGLKPLGAAAPKWHEARDERRGGIVNIEPCD